MMSLDRFSVRIVLEFADLTRKMCCLLDHLQRKAQRGSALLHPPVAVFWMLLHSGALSDPDVVPDTPVW
jgi:hypothetical protein